MNDGMWYTVSCSTEKKIRTFVRKMHLSVNPHLEEKCQRKKERLSKRR